MAWLAGGAAALNQWLEAPLDALMERTRNRPLPAGRLRPETALVVGALSAAGGLAWLGAVTNLLTALLGALALVTYVCVYTPLKRVTWLNTLVGTIPGALPVVMGWTAAGGALDAAAGVLFAIVALWQLPHFLAIAWLYRADYARAGFRMLPVVERTGQGTARLAVVAAGVLLPASLAPVVLDLVGPGYLVVALALGMAYWGCAVGFARSRSVANARRLFLASLLYLPLLLGGLTFSRLHG